MAVDADVGEKSVKEKLQRAFEDWSREWKAKRTPKGKRFISDKDIEAIGAQLDKIAYCNSAAYVPAGQIDGIDAAYVRHTPLATTTFNRGDEHRVTITWLSKGELHSQSFFLKNDKEMGPENLVRFAQDLAHASPAEQEEMFKGHPFYSSSSAYPDSALLKADSKGDTADIIGDVFFTVLKKNRWFNRTRQWLGEIIEEFHDRYTGVPMPKSPMQQAAEDMLSRVDPILARGISDRAHLFFDKLPNQEVYKMLNYGNDNDDKKVVRLSEYYYLDDKKLGKRRRNAIEDYPILLAFARENHDTFETKMKELIDDNYDMAPHLAGYFGYKDKEGKLDEARVARLKHVPILAVSAPTWQNQYCYQIPPGGIGNPLRFAHSLCNVPVECIPDYHEEPKEFLAFAQALRLYETLVRQCNPEDHYEGQKVEIASQAARIVSKQNGHYSMLMQGFMDKDGKPIAGKKAEELGNKAHALVESFLHQVVYAKLLQDFPGQVGMTSTYELDKFGPQLRSEIFEMLFAGKSADYIEKAYTAWHESRHEINNILQKEPPAVPRVPARDTGFVVGEPRHLPGQAMFEANHLDTVKARLERERPAWSGAWDYIVKRIGIDPTAPDRDSRRQEVFAVYAKVLSLPGTATVDEFLESSGLNKRIQEVLKPHLQKAQAIPDVRVFRKRGEPPAPSAETGIRSDEPRSGETRIQ